MAARTPRLDESVASLQGGWRRWLRARHGSLSQSHEDLIQQTTADLLEWMSRREGPLQAEDLRRVGFRVLERRAFDAHRDDVRRWANEPLHSDDEDIEAPGRGPEQSVEYAQLLKAIVEVLTHLSVSDRELILRDELLGGPEKPSALTPAERKRLSRLRRELRMQLLQKHRIDISGM